MKMAIQDRGDQPGISRWSARSWTLQRLDSAGLRRIEDRGRAGPRPRMTALLRVNVGLGVHDVGPRLLQEQRGDWQVIATETRR